MNGKIAEIPEIPEILDKMSERIADKISAEVSGVMPCDVIIVRYDEIALKSPPVRGRFEKTLVNRIKTALSQHDVPYSGITREWGRIFVHTDNTRGADVIARVFGTASTSPAVTTGATIDAVAETAAQIGKDLVRDGESFAIRASRSGVHDFTSIDLGRVCGDAVSRCTPGSRVDLTNPDREIFIDMRQNRAYVYTKRVAGVGGLPYGSQGKMVALMSGGIDSPVAAWMMMKRGAEIVPLYCDLEEFGDPASAELARENVNRLKSWSYAGMKAYTVPYGSCLRAIREHCDLRTTCVVCRRMMYRIGAAVAERENACGIITGSSLGQVASQTARNMFAEMHGSDIPIYHPLIGLDKREIIERAIKIGTFPQASPAVECMAVPDHPGTAVSRSLVEASEKRLDVAGIVADAVAGLRALALPGD